ncbi:homoserine kinase [Georgenia sp. Z1344]|uniref:homoserine kinase n=1 Tax=Georgenia sp. Z1344 TaxID=3416706 RepID=UPI003CFBC2D0
MSRVVADAVAVRVPATSANLGPGFDSLGLALGLHDDLEVRATTGAARVTVTGEGADSLPEGEDHLVVRAVRLGLEAAGAPQVGLDLRATNRIPHGRGLGSSAAAVVAGLLAARGLLDPGAGEAGGPLDDPSVLALATELEGHPDNAAPALLGGATVAWIDDDEGPTAVRLALAPAIDPTVVVPVDRLSTTTARAALPASVPHADAARTAGRAALLVHALAGAPERLLAATVDWLHQEHRRASMPATLALVDELRAQGLPAVVSGAGPSVLVLAPVDPTPARLLVARGWRVVAPGVDLVGAQVRTIDA